MVIILLFFDKFHVHCMFTNGWILSALFNFTKATYWWFHSHTPDHQKFGRNTRFPQLLVHFSSPGCQFLIAIWPLTSAGLTLSQLLWFQQCYLARCPVTNGWSAGQLVRGLGDVTVGQINGSHGHNGVNTMIGQGGLCSWWGMPDGDR